MSEEIEQEPTELEKQLAIAIGIPPHYLRYSEALIKSYTDMVNKENKGGNDER
jgi:hypothetical protein